MSIIPFLHDFICDDGYYNHHGGFDLHPLLQTPRMNQLLVHPGYGRHYCYPHASHHRDPKTSVTKDKDGFQVCMDVQHYKPSEISVKTVDNSVVIEAKHEDRHDEHGCISRHMVRKYSLPPGYDANSVMSSLSSDGVLIVKAPNPKKAIGGENERIVQIQQTGPAHLNVKDKSKDEKEASDKTVSNGK